MSKHHAETEIRAIEAKFVENANAANAVKLVKEFYADDALLLPAGTPENAKGTEALVAFWNQMFVVEGAVDITMETDSVHASGDLATEVGRYGFTTVDTDGKRTRNSGKYVVVFRKHHTLGYQAIVDIYN